MNKYRIQLALRAVRRFFLGTKNYSSTDLLFVIESVNSMYGIDLAQPQHGHKAAQIKQALVAYLEESGEYKTDTEMTTALWAAGVSQRGFSRRNVTHMLNTIGTDVTDTAVLRVFKQNITSNL